MTWPTNEAVLFVDPFVFVIAGSGALLSGLIAFPFLFIFLRNRRLSVALPIMFASVLLYVAVVAPLWQALGWIGAYPVLLLACLICHYIPWTDPWSTAEAVAGASDLDPPVHS